MSAKFEDNLDSILTRPSYDKDGNRQLDRKEVYKKGIFKEVQYLRLSVVATSSSVPVSNTTLIQSQNSNECPL